MLSPSKRPVEGYAAPKSEQRRSVKFGRKPKLSAEQIEYARKPIEQGESRYRREDGSGVAQEGESGEGEDLTAYATFMTPVASIVKTQKSFILNGGRDRTRTCDLLRGRHALPHGRGSDWGFTAVHFCVARPRGDSSPGTTGHKTRWPI